MDGPLLGSWASAGMRSIWGFREQPGRTASTGPRFSGRIQGHGGTVYVVKKQAGGGSCEGS